MERAVEDGACQCGSLPVVGKSAMDVRVVADVASKRITSLPTRDKFRSLPELDALASRLAMRFVAEPRSPLPVLIVFNPDKLPRPAEDIPQSNCDDIPS
jgi:hypothetical protein